MVVYSFGISKYTCFVALPKSRINVAFCLTPVNMHYRKNVHEVIKPETLFHPRVLLFLPWSFQYEFLVLHVFIFFTAGYWKFLSSRTYTCLWRVESNRLKLFSWYLVIYIEQLRNDFSYGKLAWRFGSNTAPSLKTSRLNRQVQRKTIEALEVKFRICRVESVIKLEFLPNISLIDGFSLNFYRSCVKV